MNTAITVIRIGIQKQLKWSEGERDATLFLFLHELEQAVTSKTIEAMAETQPERFVAMFIDWAKHRPLRDQENRIKLLIEHVARNATGVPFGYAKVYGNKDITETPSTHREGNVVSLF